MYKEDLKKVVGRLISEMEQSMLEEIHKAVCDDGLDDFGCVEEIVGIFEKNGISCNSRHDFQPKYSQFQENKKNLKFFSKNA